MGFPRNLKPYVRKRVTTLDRGGRQGQLNLTRTLRGRGSAGTCSERMAVAAVKTSLNTTKPCSFMPPAFFATTSRTGPNCKTRTYVINVHATPTQGPTTFPTTTLIAVTIIIDMATITATITCENRQYSAWRSSSLRTLPSRLLT